MSDVWEHTDRVTCTHPGWVRLTGWSEIASAFMALFNADDRLQFVLTDEQVHVDGRVGWVNVDENLLGGQGGATVSSLNIFVESGYGRWRMVSHMGSLVSPPIEEDEV